MKESYERQKENAREYAREMQEFISKSSLSYGELAEIQERLETLAHKYGLYKEFKENGII